MDRDSALVQRATDQIACDMGGEVVILDMNSGTYYGLDSVGAKVWAAIEQPASVAAIREAIVGEFDVDVDTCERDIRAFLEEMQAAGLIAISHAAGV